MPHLAAYSPPAAEPQLDRAARRARGVYYTPPEVVQPIVEWTLGPLLPPSALPAAAVVPPRVLDPACGAGEFLVAAYRRIAAVCGAPAACRAVYGLDIDSRAVAAARTRLRAIDRQFPSEQVLAADALAPEAMHTAPFDAVVGNPPYVNIRQLAKALSREQIAALRSHFQTARGNFDLYTLFIERALALLRPGGRCGLIVPNKWAVLDYARPCRELLLKHAVLERVVDLSHQRVFAAATVFPHVLIFQKHLEPPPRNAAPPQSMRLVTLVAGSREHTQPATLAADSFSGASLDVESRAATLPLCKLAQIACGTTGYAAAEVARRLVETTAAPRDGDPRDFITSGNIDRYAIRLGEVRFLGRQYPRPRLPLDAPELSPAKRRLFASPKIVVAGMSRRLEAAWDERGLALGVQVFALTDCRLDPLTLLALLNSKLLSYLFATRFAAKRLSGGYLAINKGQLARLPIVETTRAPARRLAQRLAELASARLQQRAAKPAARSPATAARRARADAHETEIDRLVYRLYELTPHEIARVEAHFSAPAARAA